MSWVEIAIALFVLNVLWSALNGKSKSKEKSVEKNPYRESTSEETEEKRKVEPALEVKGFFEVEDSDGMRRLIDASLVAVIVESDEDETTIYYKSNSTEEEYVECANKYNDVVTKFAKARA